MGSQGEHIDIFRGSAVRRLSSPHDLERYVRVVRPRGLVFLIAIILFVAAGWYWAATSVIVSTVQTTGVVRDGQITCFVSVDALSQQEARELMEGTGVATVGSGSSVTTGLRVEEVRKDPVSREDAEAMLGDEYLMYVIQPPAWSYVVVVDGGQFEEGSAEQVSISMTDGTHPLSFILDPR